MEIDDNDFRSLDIKVELPEDPFARLGKQIIDRMLANARDDRRESKKRVKTLINIKGTIVQQKVSRLYLNF